MTSNPSSFPYIERAVLMEDIKLPILNEKKKLKRGFFYSARQAIVQVYQTLYYNIYPEAWENKEYKLAYNEIKNVDAKFYIPILMTLMNNNGTEVKTANRAPKTTGFVGNIKANSFNSSNCVTLTIPKYIVLQFLDHKNEKIGVSDPIIPKGTEFLIACVRGNMDIEQMRIIGLYTLTYERSKFPGLTDDYYGGNPVK